MGVMAVGRDSLVTRSFLGANTSVGFYSLFEEFAAKAGRVYIVKGGPGTGKSSFIRKIGDAAAAGGYDVEHIHCSSDPSSLDGIFVKELSLAVCDGTPPHVMEPPVPGAAGGLFDLGRFWDENLLCDRESDIRELMRQIKVCFDKAYRLLAAAGKLQNALFFSAAECADIGKLCATTDKLIKRTVRKTKQQGALCKRFITGITPDGVVTYNDSLTRPGIQLIVISDEYGLSSLMLERIREQCLALGHNVTACYSPLIPDSVEHVILPQAGVAFAVSNRWHPLETERYGRIRIERFMDREKLRARRVRLHYMRKTQKELILEAVEDLREAKRLHDILEKHYIGAMDFSGVDALCESAVQRLLP